MTTLRAAALLLSKELRSEFRTRELLHTTIVFVLVILILFSFTFDPTDAEARRFGPGLLWLAIFFAASLMLNPSFTREQSNDTLAALRLAPISPFSLFLGKALANFVFLTIAEAILLPVFAVLYNLHLGPVLGRLILVLVLGTLGVVLAGTAFSAISAQARMRELLLPLLLLPVLTPVLIASVESTVALLSDDPELPFNWLQILLGFDIIFFTASGFLCEYLFEE